MPTRIIIADDHAIVRDGLRSLLDKIDGFTVVGEAATGEETLALLMKTPADVLVLDLSMPGGLSGARVAEEVIKAHKSVAIVVLTMHDDDYYLRELLEIGVHAYVLKNSGSEKVVAAIRAASQREYFVDPAMSSHLVSAYIGRPAHDRPKRIEILSGREREVCALLAMGHTNAEVGKKLHISERTVETHRMRIMARLGLNNRAGLVQFAIDNELIKSLK